MWLLRVDPLFVSQFGFCSIFLGLIKDRISFVQSSEPALNFEVIKSLSHCFFHLSGVGMDAWVKGRHKCLAHALKNVYVVKPVQLCIRIHTKVQCLHELIGSTEIFSRF